MKTIKPIQETHQGKLFIGASEKILKSTVGKKLQGKVQLIFTSPPFPLNLKKRYGNKQGTEYIEWLSTFAPLLANLLTPNGSIVIELGNAWEPQKPIQSLLPLQSLLSFVQHPQANLVLCQEFICYNPARLPSPAPWVTIERCRVTDSYTHLWWMAKTDKPKADNRKILRPYSKSAKKLHERGSYNHGPRPSGHVLSEKSFLKQHEGSIIPNVIEMEAINEDNPPRLPTNAFNISHTTSNDYYSRQCKERNIEPHPARMPLQLVDLFIQFLTDKNDIVLDPFAGSNATGFCAARSGRRWVSIEANEEYAVHSTIRFSELLEESSTNHS